MIPPIVYIWHEITQRDIGQNVMLPASRFSRLAEQSLTSGKAYRMIIEEERSYVSHRQYFAAVREAWLNLPEHLQLAFPTEDHLRRYALIKAGFCDIKKVADSRHVAVDGYAIVVNEDGVTTVYSAKSQSYRAMGKAEFARSRDAVLELLAEMVGVTPDQLMQARAA